MTGLEKIANDEIRAKRRPKFPRVWLDDTTTGNRAEYLIKGLLDRASLGLIYGPSGCGKTFFAIDVAAHIATGLPWRGQRVRRGLVVYVAAEAGLSIEKRFASWRDRHLGEICEERTPLVIVTRGVNLLDAGEVESLVEELHEIVVEAQLPLSLVVLDTLSRSIPGGDENSPVDMTKVVAAADRIRNDFRAAVAFIHHSGKDPAKGARGHSALFAAADTVIAVNEGAATVEKLRDGATDETFAFSLDVVELGMDADGDAITTCVIVPTETRSEARSARPLSGAAQTALQVLQEAISEHGERMAGSSTIPDCVRAVTIMQWRARFRTRYGTDDRGDRASRQAFQRARESLLREGKVAISDPFAWIP